MIDTRLENNEREIEALIAQAHRFPKTVTRVIVGNEVLFRGDLPPDQVMSYLDRVRAAVRQPVSVAEPFHIWLQNPELADHVDFITVHLFPYWNGIEARAGVTDSIESYKALRAQYPGKHIVIGEIGWPSNGDRYKYAYPERLQRGDLPALVLQRGEGQWHRRLLRPRSHRPAVEGKPRRRPHRRVLGHVQRRPPVEVPLHRPGDRRRGLAVEGASPRRSSLSSRCSGSASASAASS